MPFLDVKKSGTGDLPFVVVVVVVMLSSLSLLWNHLRLTIPVSTLWLIVALKQEGQYRNQA